MLVASYFMNVWDNRGCDFWCVFLPIEMNWELVWDEAKITFETRPHHGLWSDIMYNNMVLLEQLVNCITCLCESLIIFCVFYYLFLFTIQTIINYWLQKLHKRPRHLFYSVIPAKTRIFSPIQLWAESKPYMYFLL
jgi:hypothetical protein